MSGGKVIYSVGDRVVAARDIATQNGEIHIGDEGTVCDSIGSSIGVAWDRNIGGHDLSNGLCEAGHGWYMTRQDIKLKAYAAPSASELSTLLGVSG